MIRDYVITLAQVATHGSQDEPYDKLVFRLNSTTARNAMEAAEDEALVLNTTMKYHQDFYVWVVVSVVSLRVR